MYFAILLLMAAGSSATGPVWVGVLGALITATAAVWGLFYVRWKEDRQRAIESELKHRERQIEEFYGPLFSLAHQIRRASEVQDGFTDFVKSKYYTGEKDRGDKEKEVRDWFRTEYFDPHHREMIQILKGKLYLIEAAKVPPSFVDYLKHACDDRARTKLCNEKEGYPPCPFRWPEDFEKQLSSGLETAMQERDKLLSRRRKGFGFGRTAGNLSI
jgi:hypothetical protein